MTVVRELGSVLLADADGRPVAVGSGRQRRLLAALALHAGTPVDRDLLAELVWGAELPADPSAALQTNVARLRRMLPASASISTGPRSYRLDVAPDALDAACFPAHLTAAVGCPDPASRLARLDAALVLWRGRPFDELDHAGAEPERTRLTALHDTALEDRAATLVELGRVTEAAAAAAALVAADPLRERAVAVLMQAQAAAGRTAEALQSYARLRAELAEQLGADPGPELSRLHGQLLRQQLADAREVPRPPVPISSFVGRDGELERVRAELRRRRVITLCGPGGVGKTRLARHVAATVADRYADGVVLVELAAATPDAVGATVATALRLTEAGPGSLTDRIVEVLAVRSQLVVLDDCEHVADQVAALVEAITVGAPQVSVLATSREPLRADGEQLLPVTPLAREPAMALLADRIRAIDPSAEVEPAVLDRICARLDRLPLALELAAARVPAAGPAGLLDALDDPLDGLGRPRRTAAARHRSLRDVVQWSFGLLDDEQRSLFVRLGVFAGPVEAAAVAAVCGSARALPDLVDRSLVLRQGHRPVGYGMLDTLRAYGRERLAAAPESVTLRTRHAAWAVALVADTAAARSRPDEPEAIRRFDAHLADITRAHGWMCARGPLEDLLRLGVVCAELGYQRARADLVRMADEALTAAGCDPDGGDPHGGDPDGGDPDGGDPAGGDHVSGGGAAAGGMALHPLLPRLLALSAVPLWQRGDIERARRRARRAVALADRSADPTAARDGFEVLSNLAMFGGDLAAAMRYGDRSAALARDAADDPARLMALVDTTLAAAYAGDQDTAGDRERAAVALAERMGSPTALGWAAYAAGERRAEAGLPDATTLLERAVAYAEEVDAVFLAGVARHTLLTTAARADDPEQALSRFGPLLDTWHGMGAWTQLWIAVRALAEALSRRGRHAEAAVLLGALRASPRASVEYGADSARVRAVEDAARHALGPRFAQLQADGARLGDSGAVALARRLARGDMPTGRARRPG